MESYPYSPPTPMQKRKNAVRDALIKAYGRACREEALPECELPEFSVDRPKEDSHGDFAANLAMLLAARLKMPPRIIAVELAKRVEGDLFCDCQVAGAGFLNFFFREGWLAGTLEEIIAEGASFGQSDIGRGKKVQVEFVSANPTGELHMGNARGAAIGDTLANLLIATGHAAEKEFYINDAGNQIEKFGLSLEARYLQLLGQNINFPDDGYHGDDITETMRGLIAEKGSEYLEAEPLKRRDALTAYALQKKIAAIKTALLAFRVRFDVWFSEQTLHDSGQVDETIARLVEAGLLYEKEGAVWLKCTDFGEEKDEVLLRSNGLPTYFATDIAYHADKYRRGFDTVINIWGADHHGHVARMKGVLEAMGYDRDRLEILLMQFVRLSKNGQAVRMSKRSGSYVTLEDLTEEIGADAARFMFVMRSPDSTLDVDLDLAVRESMDNPVYYVQYAHVRIRSILSNAAARGLDVSSKPDYSLLNHESELRLIRRLADFPDEVIAGALRREPHRLAIYIQELSGALHNFYNHCRVLEEPGPRLAARLKLLSAVDSVIVKALGYMGVTAPEKM